MPKLNERSPVLLWRMKVWPVTSQLATLSYMPAEIIAGLPEVFTHADARRAGISDRDLYQMRDRGVIDRIARGIYTHPGFEADLDLVEIVMRAPNATLCLTSALAHHDLIDDIPPAINVALPRSQRPPRTEAPVAWHRFDSDTFNIGRTTTLVTDQLAIGIYSPTRTIVDAYRLRDLYGTDQALEALKRWLRIRGNQPVALLEMASRFPRSTSAIQSTLETLL